MIPPSRGLIWLLRLLCVVALGVSSYLAITTLRAEEVYGCGSGTVWDCGHVLSSRWSKVLDLPVSVPAVALYGLLLVALTIGVSTTSLVRKSWGIISIGAILAGLAASWFVGLQVFALGHLCPWCLIAHSCGLIMCLAILWQRPLGTRMTALLSIASVAGVAALIGGQVLFPPQTYKVERHPVEETSPVFSSPHETDSESPPSGQRADEEPEIFDPFSAIPSQPLRNSESRLASGGPLVIVLMLLMLWTGISPTSVAGAQKENANETSQDNTAIVEPQPAPRRIVSISSGQTRLDVRQWPLLGQPDAKYVFVEMYDYTCPHCRTTHQAVEGAMNRYGNDLAVVALPVPLNRACNDAITSTNAKHADACELAKIAVAVWRIQPERFTHFHDWLFEPAQGRTSSEARRYAAQLVGEDALREELALDVAGKYVAKHVELYKRAGSGSVPKLLFPGSTVVGEVGSTQTLCSMIERELGGQ